MSTNLQRKNSNVMIACVLVVGGMVGLSFAAVPLYNLFCRVTGYAGTTQVATTVPDVISDKTITIRFDASTNVDLPWRFYPEQKELTMRIGETALAFYRAESKTDRPTVGTATFNVTPQKIGQYFVKTDCFCFTEQMLQPRQGADMPVTFYVDPEILNDPNARDVDTITLSYTFFELDKESEDAAIKENTAALDQAKKVN